MKKTKKMTLIPSKETVVSNKPNNTKSVKKTILKVACFIAAVNGIIKIYSMIKEKKQSDKKLQPGEKVYDMTMDSKRPSFQGEYVKKITVKGKMSGMDMDLNGAHLADDTYIYLNVLMSGICIRIPENVNVTTEIKSIAAGISNTVPKYLDDSLPLIHIIGKSIMSGVDIRVTVKNEDNEEA